MPESSSPYRVLARKYRPQTFAQLIGQDAMVTTLGNAIRRDRLAHAFLLTGVRGVGKTSTARLIAKALNCVGPDGTGGPTIDPCGVCDPCVAIAEGRYMDVIEMDAASNRGIDSVREVTEIVRTGPNAARFLVYIVDEVHMMTKEAFNALLKTLEEPPERVKFILATTEVNKVPVTVLSRCQRFDLRRIPAEKLAAHFAHVVQAEAIEAEPEALALIARAAEGSARDGLSILDQAIAHGSGGVTAGQIRDMLGLSDRGAVRRLFGHLLSGDAPAVLAALAEQHELGVEPASLLHGLLEAAHGITRAKVGGAPDPAMSVEERDAYADWASRLGFATLHRLWQLLLKGHGEVQSATLPREAAEMALLRIVHASSLPDPAELMRRIASGEALPAAPAAPAPADTQATLLALPVDYPELIERLERAGKRILGEALRSAVGLVRYEPPALVLRPTRPLGAEFVRELAAALKAETGIVWDVATADGPSAPSLFEQETAAEAAVRDEILGSPVVRAAFEAFPDAELIRYTAG